MTSIKLADGTIVTGELVRTERKVNKLKVYRIKPTCPLSFKGKQRQATVDALRSDPDRYFSREELAEIAGEKVKSVYPAAESIGWHLNQLELLGHVESK